MVSPEDFEQVKLLDGKSFFLGKQLSTQERKDYLELLSKFNNVFS